MFSVTDGMTTYTPLLQVYRAQLKADLGAGEVAVKVLRPGVLEQVRMDMSWGCR